MFFKEVPLKGREAAVAAGGMSWASRLGGYCVAGCPYCCTDSTQVVFSEVLVEQRMLHAALHKWLAATNGRKMSWSWGKKNTSARVFQHIEMSFPGTFCSFDSVARVSGLRNLSLRSQDREGNIWSKHNELCFFWGRMNASKYLTSLVPLRSKLAWLIKPKLRWEVMPENIIYSSHLRENSRCFVWGGTSYQGQGLS